MKLCAVMCGSANLCSADLEMPQGMLQAGPGFTLASGFLRIFTNSGKQHGTACTPADW